MACRRKRNSGVSDATLLDGTKQLEALATKADLAPLGDTPDVKYEVPSSAPIVLTNAGILR